MITLAEKLLLKSEAKQNGYVEFVSSTPMSIIPKYTNAGVTLQYSLNGSTWTTIATKATTPSANIIYFRGRATGTKSLYDSAPSFNTWTFTGATNLECNGKLDRLIQNALGSDDDILTIDNNCFFLMFQGVTSLISVDDDCLPATTLADACYSNMFQGCTSLTTAPKLPATTLAAGCYYDMFNGCTKIKLSTTRTGIYDTGYRIPTTGTGTTATNALANMFASTGGTFKGTPTINTTYYTENTPV